MIAERQRPTGVEPDGTETQHAIEAWEAIR
jgi:hypothetical protein